MLTDEQFDMLADKLLKKIAPKLGVELKASWVTMITRITG